MKTHHLLKLATALLLATLFSCQKETTEIIEPESATIEPPHNSGVTTEYLGEDQLAPLIGYIEKRTGKSASKDGQGSTHIETGFGTIYLDHALKAIDTLGKSNISFRIYPREPQPRLTFNLVVGHAPEGQERPIYVIALEKSEAYYAGEMAGTNSPADFTGKLHRYPIDGNILKSKHLAAKELCEPMDVNPSPAPEGDGGGGGGGGGGNMGPGTGDGGDGGGGVYYPCTVTIVYDNCSVGGNADGHKPQKQEGGGYCSGSPIAAVYYSGDCGIDDQMNKAGTTSKIGDCPEPDGPVPINIYDHLLQTLDSALDLTQGQKAFLAEPDNNTLLGQLYSFWQVNSNVFSDWYSKQFIEAITADEFNVFQQDYKNRMSVSEKAIFNSLSIFHQMAYLVNAQKATWESENIYPNSLYNGKGDAFRHAYFNGLNAILLGPTLAEDLATAHEDKPAPPNYPNYFKEVQMDLFNNQVGRDKRNWLGDGYDSLTESILEALTNGELRYLSNLQGSGASGRATNQSQLIPTN